MSGDQPKPTDDFNVEARFADKPSLAKQRRSRLATWSVVLAILGQILLTISDMVGLDDSAHAKGPVQQTVDPQRIDSGGSICSSGTR